MNVDDNGIIEIDSSSSHSGNEIIDISMDVDDDDDDSYIEIISRVSAPIEDLSTASTGSNEISIKLSITGENEDNSINSDRASISSSDEHQNIVSESNSNESNIVSSEINNSFSPIHIDGTNHDCDLSVADTISFKAPSSNFSEEDTSDELLKFSYDGCLSSFDTDDENDKKEEEKDINDDSENQSDFDSSDDEYDLIQHRHTKIGKKELRTHNLSPTEEIKEKTNQDDNKDDDSRNFESLLSDIKGVQSHIEEIEKNNHDENINQVSGKNNENVHLIRNNSSLTLPEETIYDTVKRERKRKITQHLTPEVSYSTRRKIKRNPDDDNVEHLNLKQEVYPDSLPCMQEISHLQKTTIDSTSGLPEKHITVINPIDDRLYDFVIHVKNSDVINSGLGAFITFIGTRCLNDVADARNKYWAKDRIDVIAPTRTDLNGKYRGRNVSVSLKGNNLHGNGDSLAFPITRFPLLAKLPDGSTKKITIASKQALHGDIDVLKERNELPNPENGFGYLKINSEKDYVRQDKSTFSSYHWGCGLINLGRYGPWYHSDRKTELEFNVKDFVFDFEPSGWDFGVTEKLQGWTQIIDITDDATGTPHRKATKNVPMYVNEVGHNDKLVENVIVREKDNRIVHYYLHIVTPMQQGETRELLVNYGAKYEDHRERKGYGLNNINENMPADNEDFNSKMKRNIHDRKLMRVMIESFSCRELKSTIRFVHNKLLVPITSSLDWFFSKFESAPSKSDRDLFFKNNQPHLNQWKARRRLHWMRPYIQNRFEHFLEEDSDNFSKTDLEFIKQVLSKMEWKLDESLNPFLDYFHFHDFETNKRLELRKWLDFELLEESVDRIFNGDEKENIKDTDVWCGITRDLVEDIIFEIIIPFVVIKSGSDTNLRTKFDDLISCAVSKIKNACSTLNQNIIGIHHYNASENLGIKIDRNEDIISKSFTSDRLYLKRSRHTENKEKGSKTILYIVCSHSPDRNKTSDKDDFDYEADETWYLLWQIVRVVHVMMTNVTSMKESNIYDFKRLCEMVNVDLNIAKTMLNQNLCKLDEVSCRVSQLEQKTISWKRASRGKGVSLRSLFSHDCHKSVTKQVVKKKTIGEYLQEHPEMKDIISQKKRNVTVSSRCQTTTSIETKTGILISHRSKSRKATSRAPQQKIDMIKAFEEENCNAKSVHELKKQIDSRTTWYWKCPSCPILPAGWLLERVKRITDERHTDNYWYTPELKIRLRSTVEVQNFLEYLEFTGSEEQAFDMFVNS